MKTWKDYRKETYSIHNNPIRPYSTAKPTAEDIEDGKKVAAAIEKFPEGSQLERFNALMKAFNQG